MERLLLQIFLAGNVPKYEIVLKKIINPCTN